jgi:hypothetical protein
MRHAVIAFAISLALLPAASFAHDKPAKGPNGGQIIHVDDAHYELVAKDNELVLFVSDDAQAARPSLEGAKATATVLAGAKTVVVDLKPTAADTMKGAGTFVAAKGLKVVVSIQETARKPTQIRFTPVD